MNYKSKLEAIIQNMNTSRHATAGPLERIRGQIEFASAFAELYPEQIDEWHGLVLGAARLVRDKLLSTAPADLPKVVFEAEKTLAPIGRVAKTYTIHCSGHAHIDMNWTWPLLETVATAHDTYTTLDRLMDLFPDLKFGQSQISIYKMMQKYCSEVWEMIKWRISEGLWQVTAGSWVEGDKNMASGESLCRHILYSKRWLKENLGLPYDTVQIDWMPDTFGHPWTLPSILSRGGIKRYYRCRPEHGPWLNWWQAPDGSRVLAFRDKGWYNADITAELLTKHFIDYTKENGLKDFLWVYGVGDHGGGVTGGHLVNARELDSWPVFPNVKLSSIDSYFDAVEPVAGNIPVNDSDFNTTFEGCYTSQSRVKNVNRLAETIIPEAETISVIADALVGFDSRHEELRDAWEHMMFNQFHDILAGSSGHAAMEEAEIRFQQVQAAAGSVKMRALRKIASRVNTSAALGLEPPADVVDSYALSFGRGAGDVRVPGGISTWSSGHSEAEPLIVFNTLPYPRSEMVMMKIWGRDWPQERLVVTDDRGSQVPGQVVGWSSDVGHRAVNVLFPANDVPAMGYRTFSVRVASEPVECEGASSAAPYTMANEFLSVELDPSSGAIKHLVDKQTGFDWVPDGRLIGLLELCREAPHMMTAWDIGQIVERCELRNGMTIDENDHRDSRTGDSLGMVLSVRQQQCGPHRIAYRTLHAVNDSRVRLEIALSAGSKSVEIGLSIDWREIGTPETGVPMLRMLFPLNVASPKFVCEIPFGFQERPADGKEIPALRWVDLSCDERGMTLANDCKYGFAADDSVLRATLIRSTYDPDAYPEMGRHEMRFTLTPHFGQCDPSAAVRAAECINTPMSVVGTGVHDGDLAASDSFVEVFCDTVSLSALKKAEDSDGLIVRLYETSGNDTEARVRLNGIACPGSRCVPVDLLEQPLDGQTARTDGDVLVVRIPAHGIATVRIVPDQIGGKAKGY